MFSFGHCPNYLSPQFGQLVPLFLDVKNDVLARITEPSNNDYDNDGSDNCDYNFGTFDNSHPIPCIVMFLGSLSYTLHFDAKFSEEEMVKLGGWGESQTRQLSN